MYTIKEIITWEYLIINILYTHEQALKWMYIWSEYTMYIWSESTFEVNIFF
jgi:hypothetical protein